MASLDRVLNDSIRWNAASFRERRSISNSSRHDVAQLPPTHVLPKLDRWHVTSQDRLIYHLRQVWPERAPRTMLDIGCHAGHGPHANLSDALVRRSPHAAAQCVQAIAAARRRARDQAACLASF